MYDREVAALSAHGLASPDGLVDVATFVLLTIQQPLQTVGRQMADVREHGAASKYLFGAKRDGYRYLVAHKEVLFAAVKRAREVDDVIGAIDVLTNVPSLGIVKAAFVAQCLGFDVACLDTHNLRALGLPEAAVKFPKGVKPETKRRKIADYVALTRSTGGARKWWNDWCAHVAGRRGSPLKTADEVSAFHTACVCA